MAVHKLSIDDFEDDDFTLIALHTSLEDYQLAYFINRELPVLLQKNKCDIQFTSREGEATFSRFTWEEDEHDETWNLLENKSEASGAETPSGDLFTAEVAPVVYLLPEFKKVDFFLKIQNSTKSIDTIFSALNGIDKITAVYEVDASRIKSKNNLIF